jgi:hypothetical protein
VAALLPSGPQLKHITVNVGHLENIYPRRTENPVGDSLRGVVSRRSSKFAWRWKY